MNHINKKKAILILTVVLAVVGCQKLDRPGFGELILDPPPPPYSTLKNLWAFEDNTGDSGQYRALSTAKNLTYTTGINGKAVQVGDGGYLLVPTINDSLKTPGSFSVAFWMNGVGPVQGGAQGLFAISHKTEFWGNIEMFLENLDNGSEAFLKIHTFNANASDGKGDIFSEVKIPNALNKWTHIAVTYNSADSKLSVYADGAPTTLVEKVLDNGNYGDLKFNDVNGMVLGSFAFQTDPTLTSHGPEPWAKSFNGALDQFRVYNVALSASEVMSLFDSKQ